jgi:hypothetical protein
MDSHTGLFLIGFRDAGRRPAKKFFWGVLEGGIDGYMGFWSRIFENFGGLFRDIQKSKSKTKIKKSNL